ncbi:c-type cytochrome [Leptospira meyeri]|uniref:Cbb3-type cytochrome c oxidase subunit III n=1 Tax=Leptospira meyeri TaxID=29508 RepID=A0A4R8MWR9_LEPME|nr:cytochrome c [Leptospira meyeri]EKJ84893.1 cytochrome C [Leptospira meyeri serovar Hardjo str. Went 5]PJZ82798.1 cytochrome C [Leptospira meyeri]PJZ97963.1 cytochrome C [Leptospira meyeri]PKA11419.1 cytochrome C [Leptospira meyeri]TDY71882.1 cbb3-type cytochrome c oxidase subunit III [Leptospira meyeri]
MKQNIFRVLALAGLLVLVNCDYKTPVYEYFPSMYDSPARESQEADAFATNGSASRIPPKGAIPVGYFPYPYAAEPTPDTLPGADKGLKNPIAKANLGDLMIGEKRYQTYCTPCHGVRGLGNGTVVGPAPRFEGPVPTLVSDNVKGWTDGQIYHIITMGRGRMGSYAYQIEPEDRWKLIAYIRKLQEYEVQNKKAN